MLSFDPTKCRTINIKNQLATIQVGIDGAEMQETTHGEIIYSPRM